MTAVRDTRPAPVPLHRPGDLAWIADPPRLRIDATRLVTADGEASADLPATFRVVGVGSPRQVRILGVVASAGELPDWFLGTPLPRVIYVVELVDSPGHRATLPEASLFSSKDHAARSAL